MTIKINYRGSWSWDNRGSMTIDLRELLYPEPWKDYDGRRIKEYPISKVKKILKLIKEWSNPEEWDNVKKFIEGNPVRRYKKYLEIWEAIN